MDTSVNFNSKNKFRIHKNTRINLLEATLSKRGDHKKVNSVEKLQIENLQIATETIRSNKIFLRIPHIVVFLYNDGNYISRYNFGFEETLD